MPQTTSTDNNTAISSKHRWKNVLEFPEFERFEINMPSALVRITFKIFLINLYYFVFWSCAPFCGKLFVTKTFPVSDKSYLSALSWLDTGLFRAKHHTSKNSLICETNISRRDRERDFLQNKQMDESKTF